MEHIHHQQFYMKSHLASEKEKSRQICNIQQQHAR